MKTTGYILNGVYVKGGDSPILDDQASTSKMHHHDRQREEHRRDLLQPYDCGGNLSTEFIEQYPEEAQTYGFNQENN